MQHLKVQVQYLKFQMHCFLINKWPSTPSCVHKHQSWSEGSYLDIQLLWIFSSLLLYLKSEIWNLKSEIWNFFWPRGLKSHNEKEIHYVVFLREWGVQEYVHARHTKYQFVKRGDASHAHACSKLWVRVVHDCRVPFSQGISRWIRVWVFWFSISEKCNKSPATKSDPPS